MNWEAAIPRLQPGPVLLKKIVMRGSRPTIINPVFGKRSSKKKKKKAIGCRSKGKTTTGLQDEEGLDLGVEGGGFL